MVVAWMQEAMSNTIRIYEDMINGFGGGNEKSEGDLINLELVLVLDKRNLGLSLRVT
jgi:hypothetical protein